MRDRLTRLTVQWLQEGAACDPPGRLDVRVRQVLGRGAVTTVTVVAPRPVLRPITAMALAIVGVLCLAVGLAVGLAETSSVGAPVEIAFAVVFIYLTVSATVTLPLLVFRSRLRAPAPEAI